jgi:hypothetical protein
MALREHRKALRWKKETRHAKKPRLSQWKTALLRNKKTVSRLATSLF